MIRQVAVMSGKGGAGKTSVTAALLKFLPEVVAVDADVNASNLPILLDLQTLSETAITGWMLHKLLLTAARAAANVWKSVLSMP